METLKIPAKTASSLRNGICSNEIENMCKELIEKYDFDPVQAGIIKIDEAVRQQKRHIAQAKRNFNKNPSKGIDYLVENKVIQREPKAIAKFLFKYCANDSAVDKALLGKYLGNNSPFSQEVLRYFCKCQDVFGVHVMDALRSFLAMFLLPGESQIIDRILHFFSVNYVEVNPDIFASADVVHVLLYAAVMLNTLMYNPNVKEKPTLQTFVKMSENAQLKGSIPQRVIREIFDSISDEELKKPSEPCGVFDEEVIFTGYLMKQSTGLMSNLSWKRRWFAASENCLYYFESENDRNAKGIITMANVSIRKCTSGRPYSFEIFPTDPEQKISSCKTTSGGNLVAGGHLTYRVAAESNEEMMKWMIAVDTCIARTNCRPLPMHA